MAGLAVGCREQHVEFLLGMSWKFFGGCEKDRGTIYSTAGPGQMYVALSDELFARGEDCRAMYVIRTCFFS